MATDVLGEQVAGVASDVGDAAESMAHDVSSEDDWQSVVDATLASFGRVDVLVNNAAIHHVRSIEEESLADHQRMLAINLTGTFLGIRAVVAPMRDTGGGSIVNISSLAGVRGIHGHSSYAATKFGVRGLTQVAAVELGPSNIRVNSVHPGPIDTDMLPAGAREAGSAAFRDLPLRRVGRVDEVAELVLFLASDASSYVSGAEIAVDGGAGAGRVPERG
jgi:3alpha(or 20beta)-hydroxysteroid dehydrogenase